jgi:hypothetical protein
MVEIREVKDLPGTPMSAVNAGPAGAEDMSTASLWGAFLAQEVERGAMSAATQEILQKYGNEVLEELQEAGGETVNGDGAEFAQSPTLNATGTAKGTDFHLISVTVQGFGPFRDEITYPLLNRGLVLLRGSNKDGGADRYVRRAEFHYDRQLRTHTLLSEHSNGSGKTSLAMSILWAFTGSIDPRPLQDSKVSDVVNDASKVSEPWSRPFHSFK